MTERDVEAIKTQILSAFTSALRPPAGALHVSEQSEEASTLLEADFDGKDDWRLVDSVFLDQAPDGFGTALGFFSDDAFRYFLPAYLIADLGGLLAQSDPVFHLTHGLTDATRDQHLVGRHREVTWWDYRTARLASLTPDEAAAVVSYLTRRVAIDELAREDINQALRNYWLTRRR